MQRTTGLPLLAVALLFAGCGGCQDSPPPPPPPPAPVQGKLAPTAPPAEAVEAPEGKEVCAVLVFANREGGAAPLQVQFSAEGDCTDGTARFDWDFNDGSPATTGDKPLHTFEKPGTYKVKVKITSDALPGVEDVDEVDLVVTAPEG